MESLKKEHQKNRNSTIRNFCLFDTCIILSTQDFARNLQEVLSWNALFSGLSSVFLSWQNIFILMADYKLSSSSSKNQKNNSKKISKIPPLHPLKKSCCPHILLFLFPYLSPIFILPEHPITPILQGFIKKQPQKGQKKKRTFSYNKKNYHKKTWCLCKYTMFQDTLKPA